MALRNDEALQQASESPDLGPPPVAHFDVGDVVAFDTATGKNKNDEDLAQLPPMLEKRRKRRTSALLQDMPIEKHSEPEKAAHQLLKSGAKRKLELTELEEPVLEQPTELDDFVFQRKQDIWSNSAALKKASRFTRPPGRENDDKTGEKSLHSPQKSAGAERKILAPKSTNSPAKRKVRVAEKLSSTKDDGEELQTSTTNRHARRSHVQNTPQIHDLNLESEQPESKSLPPKTPASQDPDVLSPTSTEPSVRTTHHTREAAISNSVEDVLNGSIGRGSRRARPAVSYALPNLRDKMRRPTKELVGAVEGLDKNKETTAVSNVRSTSTEREGLEDANPAEDLGSISRMKQEKHASGGKWKQLALTRDKKEEPTSPLRDKERKEKDREKIVVKHDRAREGKRDSDELERAVDRLSIFDPPASSPIDEDKENEPPATATSRRRNSAAPTTRRHSVHPSSSSSIAQNQSSAITSRPNPSSGAHLPRANSAASLRLDPGSGRSKGLRPSNSVSSNLGQGSDTNGPGSTVAATTTASATSSTDRAASRRRSMMV